MTNQTSSASVNGTVAEIPSEDDVAIVSTPSQAAIKQAREMGIDVEKILGFNPSELRGGTWVMKIRAEIKAWELAMRGPWTELENVTGDLRQRVRAIQAEWQVDQLRKSVIELQEYGQKSLEDRNDQIRDLKTLLEQAKHDKVVAEDEWRERVHLLVARNDELLADRESLDATISNLEESLKNLRDELSVAERARNEWRSAFDEAAIIAAKKDESIQILENNCNRLTEENTLLRSRAEVAEAKVAELSQPVQTATAGRPGPERSDVLIDILAGMRDVMQQNVTMIDRLLERKVSDENQMTREQLLVREIWRLQAVIESIAGKK